MPDSLTQTFNELSLLIDFKNRWDEAVRAHMSEQTFDQFRKAVDRRPPGDYTKKDHEDYKQAVRYGPDIVGYQAAIDAYRKHLAQADQDIADICTIMGRGYARSLVPAVTNASVLRPLAVKYALPALKRVI